MIIGCTKELKNHEYRVGLTPDNALSLIRDGHSVLIETQAGAGADFSDEEYLAVGCRVLPTAKEVYQQADMIIKVKEPEMCELPLLKEGQILYTYLHLAANKPVANVLLPEGEWQVLCGGESSFVFEEKRMVRGSATLSPVSALILGR